MKQIARNEDKQMTRRFNDLIALLLLGLAIALAPMACSGDDGNNDGAVDHMTPG
jgi:hypothetical protein